MAKMVNAQILYVNSNSGNVMIVGIRTKKIKMVKGTYYSSEGRKGNTLWWVLWDSYLILHILDNELTLGLDEKENILNTSIILLA